MKLCTDENISVMCAGAPQKAESIDLHTSSGLDYTGAYPCVLQPLFPSDLDVVAASRSANEQLRSNVLRFICPPQNV